MVDSFPKIKDAKVRYNLVIECAGKIGALMRDMGMTEEEAMVVLTALSSSMQEMTQTKVIFHGPTDTDTC